MTARNPRLAKIHIARKELALDDGAYRKMLHRLTGKTSSADCSDAQLDAVLEEFKAKGWKPSVVAGSAVTRPAAGKARRAAADHPVARKARALWISLHQLGVVRDRSDKALEAFARRQLQVEAFQWADQGQGYKLIEALKAMAEREGWSQDTTGYKGQAAIQLLKSRLAALIAKRQAEAAD
ncbi:DUF1018 domain-containing protein [Caulobacter sp. SLTY]|uniref:gp16 family protein n=1 Tax=Caulobacter sp. SLTY TaxID=2683262 RepID=UPI001412AD18|nr:regulatory protein GemA [Caulobacter sp. SLTY]NBB17023.1 DUF1018 domain-containing protein [Caulobacter sp. SLTY]